MSCVLIWWFTGLTLTIDRRASLSCKYGWNPITNFIRLYKLYKVFFSFFLLYFTYGNIYVSMCACVLSCIYLFSTPWTVTHKAPLSMEFSRQEYWSGLSFPPPGDLPNPRIELRSTSMQVDSLPWVTREALYIWQCVYFNPKLLIYPSSPSFPFGNHELVF